MSTQRYNHPVLNEQTLRSIVPQGAIGGLAEYHARIGSTNDRAIELAELNSPHGTLVVAEEQTAGRGRGGRGWWTPSGAGLALSVLLRPGVPATPAVLTGLGALAVCEAIEELGGKPEIKWPNDVLLSGKKTAGVLAEASWVSNALEYVVLGVGVNVRKASLPPSVDFPATCLDEVLGQRISRIDLLASILRNIDRWAGQLDQRELLSAWDARLAYRGQVVSYGKGLQGAIAGLGPEGELSIKMADGLEVNLNESEYNLRLVDREKE